MSEFRQDLVTGEWVITAPERVKRPHDASKKPARKPSLKSTCPFENPKKSGNWPPVITYPALKNAETAPVNWEVMLLRNKYPALVHTPFPIEASQRGIYMAAPGEGEHDIVITRSHTETFADLKVEKMTNVLRIIQERYRRLRDEPGILYSCALHNWGPSAGASLYHPHCQIISIPVIPFFVSHSIEGSERYFHRHERCVHCDIIKFEIQEGERVVEKNSGALAFAPFASKRSYEVRVFPRDHLPSFEDTPLSVLKNCAGALGGVLKRMKKSLSDPDLNFYIHSAPLKNKNRYHHYHWHIEVIPNISPSPGGFELGTGIDINAVGPENAAVILRAAK
jgi:UDPglucose--hexose-1-phosphate uridylyltransferase